MQALALSGLSGLIQSVKAAILYILQDDGGNTLIDDTGREFTATP